MDADRFDGLARTFATLCTRRGLLGVLGSLPLAGTLTTLLADDAAAAGRRKRRKKRNQRGSGKGKDHRKGKRKGKDKGDKKCIQAGQTKRKGRPCCQGLSEDASGRCVAPSPPTPAPPCVPQSDAAACGAQICGTATNNCGQEVSCAFQCAGCCDGNTCLGPDERTNTACEGTGGVACSNCLSGNSLCRSGVCQACDVCLPVDACDFTSVVEAIGADPPLSTILVCPGTYFENAAGSGAVSIDRDLSLIGAGDGEDDDTNTILRPSQSNEAVVRIVGSGTPPEVTLEGLRVTGGTGLNGRGLALLNAIVDLSGCTIAGNETATEGGIFAGEGADLTLTDTRITVNTGDHAGGIDVQSSAQVTLDTLSRITDNTATGGFGGIRHTGSGIVHLPSVENVTSNTSFGSNPQCGGGGTFTGAGNICTSS